MTSTKCGAKTRAGYACQRPALANGRCKWHGGKSTGPKTEAGKAQSRANGAKGGRPRKGQIKAESTPKVGITWAEKINAKSKVTKPMCEQKRDAWLAFLANKRP